MPHMPGVAGQPVDKTQATLQRVCDNCHKLQCDLQRDAAQAQPQREPEPEAWLPRLSSLPSAVTGIAAYGITAPFMWLKGVSPPPVSTWLDPPSPVPNDSVPQACKGRAEAAKFALLHCVFFF